jgi:uncharacterized membrane protein YhaH (DUF805 family)
LNTVILTAAGLTLGTAVVAIGTERSSRRIGRARFGACALTTVLVLLSYDVMNRLLSIVPDYASVAWAMAALTAVAWFMRTVVQRLRDIGQPAYKAFLIFVPVAGLFFLVGLLLIKSAAEEEAIGAFD